MRRTKRRTSICDRLLLFVISTGIICASTYAAAATKAEMTAPAPGSTLTASTVMFQWNGGSGVSRYWLEIGTTVGAYNLYGQDAGTNLSATVSGLPTNGSTLYVRLWSLIDGAWVYNDYTNQAATAASAKAQMTAPAPGSTLSASTVTFQWNGGTGVSRYWLDIGTTAGATNLHTQDRGTSLSATIAGLPTNGSVIYVRLWSLINAAWVYNDYTYQATTTANAKAQMTAPAPGSTLTASTVTFQWNGGTGVSDYWLDVGTSAASSNLLSQDRGTNLNATVMGLPTNGVTLYVRLWSLINGAWVFNDYTYQAATVASAKAQMTAPAPGSTLTASTVTFQWTGGTGVTDYWLDIGTLVAGSNVFSQDRGTNLSATVTGLPTNGSALYARLWSLINGAWVYNDYTYHAVTAATAKAQMTSPAPASTLTASTVVFQWSGGSGVTQYWLDIGSAQGTSNISSQNRGTSLSATVTGLPTDGSIVFARLWSMINGAWDYNDYGFWATSAGTARAEMVTPAPGSTLTASTVTFQWNGGTGVSRYWLEVGASPGVYNLYSQAQGASLSATVSGLPTNGGTVYVRLWSLINNSWLSNEYTYHAVTAP
jgi:hypothetical protein